MTRRTMVHAALALLVFGSSPAEVRAQTPRYDLSALDVFWSTVDVLAADREPSEAEWERLLEHPGYAQVERQGGRGRAVRRCMPLVFQPSRRGELADALESADVRVRRVCGHLETVRAQRARLRAFEAELADARELAEGVALAATMLPAGATDGAPPDVYVILFEENGFGGGSLALDQALLQTLGAPARVRYLAHEFHHAFRGRIGELEVDSEHPDYLLVAALASLAEEGLASLLDKRHYIDAGFEPSFERERALVTEFNEAFERTHEILAEVDRQLLALARGGGTPAEIGPEIKDGLPWGGHPTGMFMALAIERASGSERLAALASNPLDFILAYQDAAARQGASSFSPEAVQLIRELQNRHTRERTR